MLAFFNTSRKLQGSLIVFITRHFDNCLSYYFRSLAQRNFGPVSKLRVDGANFLYISISSPSSTSVATVTHLQIGATCSVGAT